MFLTSNNGNTENIKYKFITGIKLITKKMCIYIYIWDEQFDIQIQLVSGLNITGAWIPRPTFVRLLLDGGFTNTHQMDVRDIVANNDCMWALTNIEELDFPTIYFNFEFGGNRNDWEFCIWSKCSNFLPILTVQKQ